ncbi:type I 3-dehydroquinase-domain-containing protein [Mycena olivaceomarginata]|nr:type I 3-dehydroquinase-domain-containing protein [Mycena olivaceomarginata]
MFVPSSNAQSRAVSPSNADRYSPQGQYRPYRACVEASLDSLCWELLDTDTVFENQHGTSIADFVASRGWDAFRQIESDILHDLLQTNLTCKVIACGGGVVELERNRSLLQSFRSHGLVIHVLREKDAVLTYIRESTHFPPYYHETAKEAWDRRAKFFRHLLLSRDTVTPDQTLALKPVEDDFFSATALRSWSYSKNRGSVARYRRLGAPHRPAGLSRPYLSCLPGCYSSATFPPPNSLHPADSQARGRFPDIPNEETAISNLHALLRHALRLGVEYIDLEATFPPSILEDIVASKGNATIIGSYCEITGSIPWTGPQTKQVYDRIVQMGADIIKMVNVARSFEDNLSLRQFVATVERNPKPIIAINLGPEFSTMFWSPVSHPLLPRVSSPGQISFYETQTILHLTGLLPLKRYYLFGCPIAHSMSPTLHNTAFGTLGLPHTYELKETLTVEELTDVMRSADFGGASVTIPYKRDIIPMLQHVSRHAKIIGAVNTISPIPVAVGSSGDNTDWRAIKDMPIGATTALVLGAGGTSRATLYALHHVGVINIYIYNRTRRKAEALAREFERLDPLLNIRVLDHLTVPLPIHPTADDDCVGDSGDIGGRSGWEPGGLRRFWRWRRRRGRRAIAWAGVEGIELLFEQGYEQCRIWTGRRAPKAQVRQKVLEVYHRSWGRDLRTMDLS